jgi:LmbE family N-acetylglucosaminyl deacetylase
LFEADEPDHVEDISGFVDTKVEALLAHESQFVTTHAIPPGDDGTFATVFGERIRDHAAAVGAATNVSRGEIFKLLNHL